MNTDRGRRETGVGRTGKEKLKTGYWLLSVSKNKTVEQAKAIIKKHGGVIRTSEAISRGIHTRTLSEWVNTG